MKKYITCEQMKALIAAAKQGDARTRLILHLHLLVLLGVANNHMGALRWLKKRKNQ